MPREIFIKTFSFSNNNKRKSNINYEEATTERKHITRNTFF